MTPRRALLLFAITQTARARSATLAAIASNADYATRLYGSSHSVDPSKLRVVWPDLMPPKLRASLRVDCDGARTLFYERHFLHGTRRVRFNEGGGRPAARPPGRGAPQRVRRGRRRSSRRTTTRPGRLGRFALSFHGRRGNDGDRAPAVGRRGWSCSCCGLPRRAC